MIDVLIVDDEPDIVNLLMTFIRESMPDIVIKTYTDPVLAISESGSDVVCLAIVDQCLPGMSGQEFIRRLRGGSDALHHDIMISGYPTKCEPTPTGSPTMVFSKPFDFHRLVKYVESIVLPLKEVS